MQPTGRFLGMHAVYVRAVDNEDAVSRPDQVAFTSETVAPTATITRPVIGEGFLTAGSSMRVEWTGVDPDQGDHGSPVGYLTLLYRVVPPPYPCIGDCLPTLIRSPDWTHVPGANGGHTFDLEVSNDYIIAVRAVDEAGASEPFLEYGRNAFGVRAMEGGGMPTLTLLINGVTLTFPAEDNPTLGVAASEEVACEVSCSAEAYGETCSEYRWGLDIPDLEEEGGWSDWLSGPGFVIPPLGTPSIHVLYVQARDSRGQTVLGSVIFSATDIPLDREVLVIDDSFDDTYPRDDQNDAFWTSMVQNYGQLDPARVGYYGMHGDGDREFLTPQVPTLGELGRYRTLVWDNRGSGFDAVSGLFSMIQTEVLYSYLQAGGELWLSGRMTVGATYVDPSGTRADLVYPKLELIPGLFAYDILKLHSTKVDNDKGASFDGRHNIDEAQPFPGRPEVYPVLQVDTQKQNAVARGKGVPHCDAVFDPIFAHAEPGFRGILDSLYVYGATGNLSLGVASPFHQKLTGIRWHDPDPDREHGRIQWFGFPMYYMKDSQAQEVFNRSLDWFREEDPRRGDPVIPRRAEVAALVILAPGLLLAAGCGEEAGPNRPPEIAITSGPVQGSEVDYRIDIGWEGTDPDGRVIRYEYAVDPPAGFTEEEIASGGPGIVTEEVPAEGGKPPVTRVSKTVAAR